MALGRRNSNRFHAAIWPGFVDAMTGLLLVLMFVLTIFMVIQFVLRETITGQENKLSLLAEQVASLTRALGLEQSRSADLGAQVGGLTTSLADANDKATQAQALIAQLTADRDATAAALLDASSRITGFEAQVAGLLAQRADLQGQVAGLQADQAKALSQQEALNLALAQARREVDAGVEAARLDAARREALDALVADLRRRDAAAGERISDLDAARIADAAAAEALRARLQDATTELTAMTLSLEEQRKAAEQTLTLLAAATAMRDDLDARLAAALDQQQATAADLATTRADLERRLAAALASVAAAQTDARTRMTEADQQAVLLATAQAALSQQQAQSTDAQRQTALLNEQVTALRAQVGQLQSQLNLAAEADRQNGVQIENLSAQLNTAALRELAERTRRLALEEADRQRLEAEKARLEAQTKDLEQYRSEFFGQLRDVLAGQQGIRIEGDRFVFSSEVLFDAGQATLSDAGKGEIAKVAAILKSVAIPADLNWIIRVDGHTDNVPLSGAGQYRNNWELSQARALSVVLFLIDQQGIDPARLSANGFGEYQPVDPADTAEARAQNRRIELKLTEK